MTGLQYIGIHDTFNTGIVLYLAFTVFECLPIRVRVGLSEGVRLGGFYSST